MTLLQKVKQLPKTPGVYLLKDADGRVVYVGKAARLRDRLKSYFQKSSHANKQPRFSVRDDIVDIEIRHTGSEIQALILEASLIKALKPRYNVAMKDDKQYFYVAFSNEQFPKVILTHQLKLKTKSKKLKTTVGPFVSGQALKSTMRTLRKIFPYCRCKRLHTARQTCLDYHLGLDPGFCCEKKPALPFEKKVYRENIARITRILQGKTQGVIAAITKEMRFAAEAKRFERAAQLREQRNALGTILAHRRVTWRNAESGTEKEVASFNPTDSILAGVLRIEGYDVSNVQGFFAVGSMAVFERNSQGIFMPKKSEYRRFKIRTITGANDPAMIREVVSRRLGHRQWPLGQIILIDGGPTQRNAAFEALMRSRIKTPPAIWSLAKRQEELYTPKGKVLLDHIPADDARALKFLRDEAHRFAIGYYRKVHQKHLAHD